MPLCTARFFGKILPLGAGDFSAKTEPDLAVQKSGELLLQQESVIRNETEGEYQAKCAGTVNTA